MSEFTVTLGGQEYALTSLPLRKARAWREQFAKPFNDVVAALADAGKIELTNGRDLAALLSTLSGTLIGSTDAVVEMLFAYSDVLARDRERILDSATDEEAMAAFVQVLKAAYPFGSLLKVIAPNGLAKVPTATRSR